MLEFIYILIILTTFSTSTTQDQPAGVYLEEKFESLEGWSSISNNLPFKLDGSSILAQSGPETLQYKMGKNITISHPPNLEKTRIIFQFRIKFGSESDKGSAKFSANFNNKIVYFALVDGHPVFGFQNILDEDFAQGPIAHKQIYKIGSDGVDQPGGSWNIFTLILELVESKYKILKNGVQVGGGRLNWTGEDSRIIANPANLKRVEIYAKTEASGGSIHIDNLLITSDGAHAQKDVMLWKYAHGPLEIEFTNPVHSN